MNDRYPREMPVNRSERDLSNYSDCTDVSAVRLGSRNRGTSIRICIRGNRKRSSRVQPAKFGHPPSDGLSSFIYLETRAEMSTSLV